MVETCGDNRFEIIESAKKRLCIATNIEDSPNEWAVIDSLLFRMWQMGWLPGCERAERTCENANTKKPYTIFFRCSACGYPRTDAIDAQMLVEETNYCPKCGAKVVGD